MDTANAVFSQAGLGSPSEARQRDAHGVKGPVTPAQVHSRTFSMISLAARRDSVDSAMARNTLR